MAVFRYVNVLCACVTVICPLPSIPMIAKVVLNFNFDLQREKKARTFDQRLRKVPCFMSRRNRQLLGVKSH